MKRLSVLISVLAMVIGLSVSAHAELVDMQDGTIYDTNTQLSWLKDAGAGGIKTWDQGVAWASSLNDGGGFAGLTGWRLPNADPNCFGYNCTNSEMGYLFNELGNKAYCDVSYNCPQAGWGLTNTGPFTNLIAFGYWSGTEYAPDLSRAWNFDFYAGGQFGNIYKTGTIFAWAVRPGVRTVGPVSEDTQPPILVVSTLSDGSWTNNGTLNISGSATDNMGISDLTINGNSVALNPDGTYSKAVTLIVGPNTINTIAVDLAGLQTTDTRTINFDPTAPYIAITTPSDNSITNQTIIPLSGTVDESSVITVKVNDDQPLQVPINGNDFTIDVPLIYGINTVEVTATDRASNESTVKRTVTFDNESPNLSITVPNQDIRTNQNSFYLEGEVTDLTPIMVVITKNQDEVSRTWTGGDLTFTELLRFTTEMTYQIVVTVTDWVGNVSTVQRNIIYDITPPTLSLNPVASPTNNIVQVLTGAVEAEATVTVICPTATVGQVSYPTQTTWTATLTNMSIGSNLINVTATDPAGNVSAMINATIELDTQAPDTTITSTPAIPTTSTSASFSFTSTESKSTFQCQMDTDAYQPCVSPKTYTGLAVGSHSFSVKATDAAGNTDLTPATYTWFIEDTVAPDTTIVSAPANPTDSTSASFSFTSTESNSTFQCQLDGGGYQSCSSPKTYTSLSVGSHTFYVIATDAAGNTDPIPTSYTWTITQSQRPDLSGKWKSLTSKLKGKQISGTLQVTNSGNTAAGSFSVTYYLSNDGITPSTPINSATVTSLKAGRSVNLSFSYSTSTPLTGKYIIAVIDSGNQITEANENNNIAVVIIP